MRQFLEALGLDLQALGMEKTPHRVAQAFGEFFSGLRENPDDEWQAPIATQSDGLVVVRNIRFHSMCEHHCCLFRLRPCGLLSENGTIAGFGHFVRAVDILARRPQLQERMTDDLCQSICRGLDPEGVLIIVKATHLCLTMRDRMAIDSNIVTTASSGCLKEGTAAYDQAWKLLMEEKKDG